MTCDKTKEKRKKENQDLIDRMKKGESLARIDTSATWFPPREIIKKDKMAVEKLFRTKEEEKDAKESQ